MSVGGRRIYYGWVIVTVVALCSFVQSQETFPVLSILLKPITEEFGWSRTSFALPMAIGTILGGFLGPIVGHVVDRSGPRWVAVVTFTLLGGLLVLMGSISTLWHFYSIQITARMITHGIIGLTLSVVVPKWFVAQRGRAAALQSLGGRGGQFLLPPFTLLLVRLGGWRMATVTQGLLIWVVAVVPAALFLRRQPEDMGLLPDGATQDKVAKQDDDQTPYKPFPIRPQVREEVSLTAREALRIPAFYLLTFANLLSAFAVTGLNLHLFPYLTDSNIPEGVAIVIITLWFFCGVVGSLVAGLMADRLSSRTVTMFNLAIMGVTVLFLPLVSNAPIAFAIVAVHGLSQGGMVTMRLLWPDYFGRRHLGTIRGLTHPVQNLAIAAGPLVGGLTYDLTSDYTLAFVAFAGGLFAAALCVRLARQPQTKDESATLLKHS